MQYRKDKYGNDISILGYGCMRFTRKGKNIDFEKAEAEVLHGLALGINYYDTAYLYSGNEECLGKIIAKNNIREQLKIATKLPQYLVKTPESIDKFFNEELRRLQTDYIDYYLMHMITDIESWNNLKKNGIIEWIEKHKADGSIRQVGFSYHGNTEMFLEVLNAYDWDFTQIQYNYMDEHTQAGRTGLMAAAKKGIPVIIMEPLRGGRLVNLLPEKAKNLIEKHDKKRSAAEWALRWLWEQPEITCVLSGMNSMEMLDENARIASEVQEHEFDDSDREMIAQIKKSINDNIKVPCTGCNYCMPCPKNVDIPATFRCYNSMYAEKKSAGRHEYAQTVGLRKDPGFASQCIACGKCEQHCPQGIEIRKKLKEADRKLRPLPYKIGLSIANKYVLSTRKKKKSKKEH